MARKKINIASQLPIVVGTSLGLYFLQKYANLLVIKQAEKDIQKLKADALGPDWMDKDFDIQQFLIQSGAVQRGEIDVKDMTVPSIKKSDADAYKSMKFYDNPNWFKKYELIVPLVLAGAGYGLTRSKNKNIQSIGYGGLVFGSIRTLLTFINGTPKTFDLMYNQSIELDKNPNKFYSGYAYNKEPKKQ